MLQTQDVNDNLGGTFTEIVAKILGIWIAANVCYYQVLPLAGINLSYNTAPLVLSVYFLVWVVVSLVAFKDVYKKWLRAEYWMWLYVVQSITAAIIIWCALLVFPFLPGLHGPLLAPYSDLLFATPWYFLPKSIEILLQQVLIVTFILELSRRLQSFTKVLVWYALCFGGIHVVYYLVGSAPPAYAGMMSIGALMSTAVFPYLILRVRGGFVYAFMIHLLFYIFLALLLQTWPPPGYGV
ncbi:MAG: hypothetical protein AAB955_01515 [Patescibacteria group bacterium]